MNDRFKFRVWDKRKNNYLKDFVFNFINKFPYITIEYFDNEYEYTHTFEENEIIIEQCTGLKDRNQKLIYEGDILDFDLSTPRNGGNYRGFIRWQKQNNLIGWMISDMDMTGDWDLRQIAHPNDWMVYGEIIGNIHENRELLEFNPEDYDIRV